MTPPSWPAPLASGPVQAIVDVPGSKSQTNRLLLLAALADGPSTISRPLRARDTLLMANALAAVGVGIETVGEDWVVTPGTLQGGSVDTGLAGTVMRFVPPLAAMARGDVHFDGDEYARVRPMATLIDALRQAGVTVDDDSRGLMPFTVRGTGSVPGGTVQIDSSASSQFISALLLAGARWDKGVQLRHIGPGAVPSLPHIAMTVAALRERGVDIEAHTPNAWNVGAGPISAVDAAAEPDLSNAAPFLAAALVTGGSVTIPGWPAVTDQPGDVLPELFTTMGGSVTVVGDNLTLTGSGAVHGLDADLHDVGELSPVLAAVAAVADSPSHLRGIGHLRGHETDRISALATEISRLGGHVVEHPDSLEIWPRALHGGRWHAYADHRMAQAGAVIGLLVADVAVDDIACTTKTLPDFPGMWSQLLGG
jgi:3-phosphoshikimate 1-carboxyvinyltransferase